MTDVPDCGESSVCQDPGVGDPTPGDLTGAGSP